MTKRFFALRGFMKSGTNWVGSLLNLHPEASCIGEFHWQAFLDAYNKNCRELPALESPDLRAALRDDLEHTFKATLIRAADKDATMIGDRTPHTIAPVVLRGQPHISLIRDGRDVLVSRMFHLFNNPEVHRVFQRFDDMRQRHEKFQKEPWFFRENPNELLANETVVRESMRWWANHLKSDEETCSAHPDLPVLKIRYEDIHSDVETACQTMFDFLDLDPSSMKPIEGHLKPGLSEERPNEFNRKGVVGDWKNYVTGNADEWIRDEADEQLRKFGYLA